MLIWESRMMPGKGFRSDCKSKVRKKGLSPGLRINGLGHSQQKGDHGSGIQDSVLRRFYCLKRIINNKKPTSKFNGRLD